MFSLGRGNPWGPGGSELGSGVHPLCSLKPGGVPCGASVSPSALYSFIVQTEKKAQLMASYILTEDGDSFEKE